MYNQALHRFAIFLACWTLVLVVAGGLVTSNDAGLSVPDWPLSYGKLMPKMEGGILYEHGHRMVATGDGRRASFRDSPRRAGRNDGALPSAAGD